MIKSPPNNMINGVATDYLNINDRAIHYGDGIFETILCNNNILFYWQQHYQRLQSSAEKLKLKCPDEKLLLNDIAQLLENNKKPDEHSYAVKIILTRGASERGYHFSHDRSNKASTGNRLVLLSPIESGYSSLLSAQLFSGDLYLCEQQASINANLAGLKHLNRLENVLARNEWNNTTDNNKFIDGLMVNANQHVIEGTMSNLFAVKDNQLFTPDLSQSGVKGIMREVIMDLAEKNNIQLSVVDIKIGEILYMDELFVTNSLIGMKSVNRLADSLYTEKNITHIIFDDLLKRKNDYAQAV